MARHVFHRDFSMCRAFALAALIGLAWILGDVPTQASDKADLQPRVFKATLIVIEERCDWGGVRL